MKIALRLDLQLSSVGSFERYETRVSKSTNDASLPHSMTCVIEVMLTTPILPGPRRTGIHSMYACAAAVNRRSTGPSSRSQPAVFFCEFVAFSLTEHTA
jgi:hypothetical protein